MTDQKTLDVMLRAARSHGDFQDQPVPEALLREAHELMKWGPTSANSQPLRILYLLSKGAREKLRPTLSATNLEKTMKAPLTALVSYDTRFWEHLPRMFHNPEAINWFKDKGAHTETISASLGYALTRMVTLTAGLGHETIIYGPGGPKAIDGMTWNGGVRLTPNADSVIIASYGRNQGSTAVSFDGTYAATQRIRIMARYSQGIGTGLQNLQNAVAGSAVGPGGIGG